MPIRHLVLFLTFAVFTAPSVASVDPSEVVHMTCDLDGDGVTEVIEFFMEAKHSSSASFIDDFTIVVNGDSTSHFSEVPTGEIICVDIDSLDNFMELAVSESGPSDDPAVFFFRYIGGELVELGKLPGRLNATRAGMVVDGSGEVQAHCRGHLLHTWFYACKFRLNAGNGFDLVREDFYPMGANLELREQLSLVSAPGGLNLSAVLPPGAKLTIVGSDDVRWCLVESEGSSQGWFELVDSGTLADGRRVHDVFHGLWNAD